MPTVLVLTTCLLVVFLLAVRGCALPRQQPSHTISQTIPPNVSRELTCVAFKIDKGVSRMQTSLRRFVAFKRTRTRCSQRVVKLSVVSLLCTGVTATALSDGAQNATNRLALSLLSCYKAHKTHLVSVACVRSGIGMVRPYAFSNCSPWSSATLRTLTCLFLMVGRLQPDHRERL